MQDIDALLIEHGVAVVFVITLLARVGAPVPAAPLLVIAGGLAVAGRAPLLGMFALAVLANLLGDAIWFWAGRRYGHRVMRLLCRISMSPDSCVRQSESIITRWGGSSLVAAKFLPGVSVVAAPMAGALHMSIPRFVGFDLLAGAIWSGLFLAVGFVFSDQIADVLVLLSQIGSTALGLAVIVVAAWALWRWWRRRQFRLEVAMPRITVQGLLDLIDGGHDPVIIDVRSNASQAIDVRRIPGATSVHLDEIHRHAKTLPHDREIVLYCNCPNEISAARAARLLREHGLIRVRPLAGGLEAWSTHGRPDPAAPAVVHMPVVPPPPETDAPAGAT